MNFLDVVVHWLHLTAAIAWIGGMIFTGLILAPVARQDLPPQIRYPLFKKIGKRFSIMGWIALSILLVTGIYKISPVWESMEIFTTPFGIFLLVKIGLVSMMITLSVLHDFIWGPRLGEMMQSKDSIEYRQTVHRISFWSRVNVILGVLIILAGAFLTKNPVYFR